ncbi:MULTISPECIES: KAP family P-loop NTPase fold protein [Enterococcus]|nr:P-loop NTPase fold protein [Enterococcus faecium]EGO9940169.1 hypothetical protein [Enterococcus faecium]EGP4874519.1 hypothetical protein [Enterococcus faecium]EGP4876979.1 hypothetical protein [Enterococcus faecium]EGP5247173.1 hypothetical protein [Enterococcus faecium]EJB5629540.1 hypothetical protein [Enterococcus faecium]
MWRDSETEVDYLNFDYLTELLTELIDNKKLLPATIGVYGDWGSGKSSLIKMAIKNLTEKRSSEKIDVLNFNGWMFEGYEDAKSVLLESILDTISAREGLSKKATEILKGLYRSVDKIKLFKKGAAITTDVLATGGIGTVIGETVKQLATLSNQEISESQLEKVTTHVRDELNHNELRKDLKKFQAEFAELLLESKIEKLVVFIDELDRCSPDTIIETLEAMRLFVFTGNTVFIIGADERHISYSVERKFAEIEGRQIDIGQEYLEKLVQYPIKIPQLNAKEVEYYIFCLLLEDSFEDEGLSGSIFIQINTERIEKRLKFELQKALSKYSEEEYFDELKEVYTIALQLSRLLAVGLNGNPRQCKRFLNTMKMREIMAKSYGVELDRKILTKIMLLEYFKPAAYEQISILSNKSETGIVEELEDLEKDIRSPQNPLNTFFQDEWGKNWLTITPSLKDADLREYLFFTRDTQKNQANIGTLKLSKNGQTILKFLQSKGSASLNSAIEKKDTIQRFDKVEIARILSDNLSSSKDMYSSKDFQNLFEWISNNADVLDETIYFLNSLSGKKIPSAAGVLFQNYLKQDNNDKKLVDLIDKWRGQNSNLENILKKQG